MPDWISPLARVAAWVAVLMLTVLSLVPGDLRPHTPMPGRLDHFMAYGLTGLVIAIGYAPKLIRLSWWGALTVAAGAFECAQAHIPGRSPSMFDAMASSGGLALGLFVASRLFDGLRRGALQRTRPAPAPLQGDPE
jgi:VanZ family protein